MNDEKMMTVDELAQRLNLKKSYIYQNIKKFPHIRIGGQVRGHIRFNLEEVMTSFKFHKPDPS